VNGKREEQKKEGKIPLWTISKIEIYRKMLAIAAAANVQAWLTF
jgi:hypothetical protein